MPESCPISGKQIDERLVRATAFLVLLGMAVYIVSSWWPLLTILMADFLIRAFGWGRFSPLLRLSQSISRLFGSKSLPVDVTPKQFSAMIGFVITLAALVLKLAGLNTPSLVLAVVLIVCAAFELFTRFCLGCKLYAVLVNMDKN